MLDSLLSLHNSQLPFFSALVLGFVAAVCPCSIALSITAIGYLAKDVHSSKKVLLNGLFYTLGRMLCYIGLSFAIIFIIQATHIIDRLEHDLGFVGERMVGPLLIVVGVLLLDLFSFKLFNFKFTKLIERRFKVNNRWTAFVIGFLFALAFCPYNAAIFFGILIPIATTVDYGYGLPIIYAIASALPVVIVVWILAYSFRNIGSFYNKIKTWELYIRRTMAIVMILAGIYYTITLTFMEHHHVH